MYKKGDTVRIRDDLQVGNEYGLVPIKMTYDMAEDLKTGTVGMVEDVMESEFAVKVGRWWWSEVMVTSAAKTTQQQSLWGFVMNKLNEADEALQSIRKVLACHPDYEV